MGYKQQADRRGFLEDLYKAQDGICYICQETMPDLSVEHADQSTLQKEGVSLDHVTSRNKGGTQLAGNCLLAHGSCNSRKGNREPDNLEIDYLNKINEFLGWNGTHYIKTEKGKSNQTAHDKIAAERYRRAYKCFVSPITPEECAKIILSRKQYGKWRWQRKQKATKIGFAKRIFRFAFNWVPFFKFMQSCCSKARRSD